MGDSNPICFQCGQPARADRFNCLPNGRRCPTCAGRLLAMLPPPLPGALAARERLAEAEVAADRDAEHDGNTPAA